MPRAGVHTRRDLALLRPALASLGLPASVELKRALLARHRRIDQNQEEEEAYLHFMRGHDEEDAPEALTRALTYARARAWHAAQILAAALGTPVAERHVVPLAEALADALHVVRDSYSSGHATRRPRGVGPVVALRAWELDRQSARAFGLVHALRHDLRFELPFAWFAREVRASDVAVGELLRLLTEVAVVEPQAREAAFEERWRTFVARRFLPPHEPPPANHEEEERRPQGGRVAA